MPWLFMRRFYAPVVGGGAAAQKHFTFFIADMGRMMGR